jgi:hypothetical protein
MDIARIACLASLSPLIILIGFAWNQSVSGQESQHPVSQVREFTPAVPPDPASPEFRARVRQLIGDLGSDMFPRREAASKELREIGILARGALEEAARSDDREVARRAKAIIVDFPKLSHSIVDALGAPIPFARVVVTVTPKISGTQTPVPENASHETTLADDLGRIGVGELNAAEVVCSVRVEHPEYGAARSDVDLTGAFKSIQLPLLRTDSNARSRAVSGTVVTTDGRPVVGAVIQCGSVRTPGEGLIEGVYPRGDAVTDEHGRFTYYLPNKNSRQDRGDLIPPNSNYELSVDVPNNELLFPSSGRFSNAAPARIELSQPINRHRFRWEAPGGGFLEKHEQFVNIFLDYVQTSSGEPRHVRISTASLVHGRRMMEGTYSAVFFNNGRQISYEPLVVKPDSPEELIFRMPAPVTFHGRVVHGVTNEPLRNAFVMGWNSTSNNNFALLTDEEWAVLGESPPNPPADHPVTKIIKRLYGMQALARSGPDGHFEIVQQPEQKFYGLMAFGRDFVPYKVYAGQLKPDADNRIDIGPLPLFPAARVVVKPVFDKGRLSVSPHWELADGGLLESEQPSWIGQLRAADQSWKRTFEMTHWLTLNEAQPIYVPADVRLKLRFDTPYDDAWTPPSINEIVQIAHGATHDAGELKFIPSLPVVVQVVDQAGQSVEGAAVRRFYPAKNAWSVVHNTDRDGRATFLLHPNSKARLQVSDLNGPEEITQAANLTVEFPLGDTPPAEPLRITVTDAQLELLRRPKRPTP